MCSWLEINSSQEATENSPYKTIADANLIDEIVFCASLNNEIHYYQLINFLYNVEDS